MNPSTPPNTNPEQPEKPANVLQDVHARMISLPIHFREKVCSECSWSVPTFYRKMRSTKASAKKDKIVSSLSNAEKEKIISVMDEVYQEFWDYCDKFRKKPSR